MDNADGDETFHEGESVPTGDEGSAVHISEFNGNTHFIPGGSNHFSGTVDGEMPWRWLLDSRNWRGGSR